MAGNFRVGALAAVLALGFCEPQMVAAQNNQTYGTFGNRTLGQSFVPYAGSFGGGIQTSPNGSFLSVGRSNGGMTVAAPAAQATVNAATSPQSSAPAAVLNSAAPLPATNGDEDIGLANAIEQAQQALGAGPLPAAVARETRFDSGAASVAARGALPYTRSTELSDRLTRFARTKGVLAGQGLDVYLSGTTARVEGAVRTPHDRVLLATILGLEPAVRQIDNRLIVEAAGTLPAK
jgi:hypothetical protein